MKPDFAGVVREHQAMVFSIAYHCLRDRGEAEDVAQEVFLELHRKLETLESPDHVRQWLRKVASHRSIDQARRRRSRPQSVLEEAWDLACPAPDGDPMLSAALRRLVAALPARARVVVVLRYQEGMTPLEIAGTLEMPVATVKSHLQRSLGLLRARLAWAAGEVRT